MIYETKKGLYNFVNKVRHSMGLSTCERGIDLCKFCMDNPKIKIDFAPFTSDSIRGFSIPKENIIVLNASRNELERNFDCGHEFIHLTKHKSFNFPTFTCLDEILHPRQDSYLEWQANEGAAELLVPYKDFIPTFCKGIKDCKSYQDYEALKKILAFSYKVPYRVIHLRIENLKYEIYQYEKGVGIDDLEILSRTQLGKKGIYVLSYNLKFDFYENLMA